MNKPSWRNEPWLGKQWLRGRMRRREPMLPLLLASRDHPLIRRLYPENTLDVALRLWDMRDSLLDRLDALPQAFSHGDAFRRNLFIREGQTIAIDWAFAGSAAIGAEIAPLVWVSGIFREILPEKIPELDKLVFESYLGGLRDAGWHGDPREVRFAYLVMALLNVTIPTEFFSFMDEQKHAALEQGFGRPITDIIDNWAALMLMARRFAVELEPLSRSLDV